MNDNSLMNIVHIVAADNVDAYRRGGSRYYRSYRTYYYSRYYYYSYYGYSTGGSSRYVIIKIVLYRMRFNDFQICEGTNNSYEKKKISVRVELLRGRWWAELWQSLS